MTIRSAAKRSARAFAFLSRLISMSVAASKGKTEQKVLLP